MRSAALRSRRSMPTRIGNQSAVAEEVLERAGEAAQVLLERAIDVGAVFVEVDALVVRLVPAPAHGVDRGLERLGLHRPPERVDRAHQATTFGWVPVPARAREQVFSA